MSHLMARELSSLALGDRFAQGYAYKLMGAAFWALRQGKGFAQDLLPIVLEGGDADTNGAATGAVLGAMYGFKAIPKVWVEELFERDWFRVRVNRFLLASGLRSLAEAKAELEAIAQRQDH